MLRKYSTLPAGPGSGEAVTASTPTPREWARSATVITVSTWSSGVTHHSPVPDPVLAHLELGLDHEQEVSVVGCGAQQRFEDQGQGDEGQIAHDQLRGGGDGLGIQCADVGAVQGGDAGSERSDQAS